MELSCVLYQRSGDFGLGVPFNIASYSFLTHLIAHHCDLKPKEFIHFIGNTHIYEDHVAPLKDQTLREPYPFRKRRIANKYEDRNDYKFEDLEIINYKNHETMKRKMTE